MPPYRGYPRARFNPYGSAFKDPRTRTAAFRATGARSAIGYMAFKRNRAPRKYRGPFRSGGWYNTQSELKYVDVAAASYACDTTGSVTALNLLAVGDDNNTRDGRQVQLKSVHIQGIFRPQDNNNEDNYARVLLVMDHQPNSSTIATIGNILVASSSLSNTNLDNRERFTILRDIRFAGGKRNEAITATVGSYSSESVQVINEFVKLNHKTTYSGTTAVIGSVATNALLLVTIGDLAAGGGSNAALVSRVRFTDH